jgi:phosphopantetheine adenylyltransferase
MAGRENVFVGVAKNPSKNGPSASFTKWTLSPINAHILVFDGASVDVCKGVGIKYMIRGVRPSYDLQQEASLDWWNGRISNGEVKTFFVFSPSELDHLSSSAIKVAVSLNHDEAVRKFINPYVFARWKEGALPTRTLYFGRSCIGKTTLLTARGSRGVVEGDKRIWEYFSESQKSDIKRDMNIAINDRDKNFLNVVTRRIAYQVDWDDFFSIDSDYDVPVLGSYFPFIPVDVFAKFNLVRMIGDNDEARREFAAKRGVSAKKLAGFDWAYKDPGFFDEEVVVI